MGPRSAVLGGPNAGHNGCAVWWQTHAGGANGTFGGAPSGATKRCTGWVKHAGSKGRAGWWLTHAGGPTGGFGG
eukprot:1550234-Pyramimonas_sp.AAC.1